MLDKPFLNYVQNKIGKLSEEEQTELEKLEGLIDKEILIQVKNDLEKRDFDINLEYEIQHKYSLFKRKLEELYESVGWKNVSATSDMDYYEGSESEYYSDGYHDNIHLEKPRF